MFKKYVVIVFGIIIFILICIKLYFVFTPLDIKSGYTKHSTKKGMKISISSEKRSYKNGETFTVKMRLKNIKLIPIKIYPSCYAYSEFVNFKNMNHYNVKGLDVYLGPGEGCKQQELPPLYLYPGEVITETYQFSPKKDATQKKKDFNIQIIGGLRGNTLFFPISIADKESNE